MPKWEYLFVNISEFKVRFLNGRELPDWKKGPDFYTYFNQLGEQGWELIGVEGAYHVFKRLKP